MCLRLRVSWLRDGRLPRIMVECWREVRLVSRGRCGRNVSSIIPILISQKMIREASRRQALLDDDEYCEEMPGIDSDESVDDLFGMGLFGGICAVMCACIAVKWGGWFLWVAAAVFALMSGLMLFIAWPLFKDEDEDNSEDNDSDR